jgi:hypothetical protein
VYDGALPGTALIAASAPWAVSPLRDYPLLPGGKTMQVQPYLFFDGRCEEAIEFYRTKLDAEVTMLMRFKDSPEPHQPA